MDQKATLTSSVSKGTPGSTGMLAIRTASNSKFERNLGNASNTRNDSNSREQKKDSSKQQNYLPQF
jgi:hypothetical protein